MRTGIASRGRFVRDDFVLWFALSQTTRKPRHLVCEEFLADGAGNSWPTLDATTGPWDPHCCWPREERRAHACGSDMSGRILQPLTHYAWLELTLDDRIAPAGVTAVATPSA